MDNGISSVEGVALARAQGIDVLVTDHHLPGEVLPEANVIVNPNLPGSRFGSRALAGVGVAFYVLAALQRALQGAGRWTAGVRTVAHWLDLVALGTVADLVRSMPTIACWWGRACGACVQGNACPVYSHC